METRCVLVGPEFETGVRIKSIEFNPLESTAGVGSFLAVIYDCSVTQWVDLHLDTRYRGYVEGAYTMGWCSIHSAKLRKDNWPLSLKHHCKWSYLGMYSWQKSIGTISIQYSKKRKRKSEDRNIHVFADALVITHSILEIIMRWDNMSIILSQQIPWHMFQEMILLMCPSGTGHFRRYGSILVSCCAKIGTN